VKKRIALGSTSHWAWWPAIGGTAAAGALVASLALGAAEASDQDKSQYPLLNPTPDRLLRDLTTDRPDITESPFTLDAGRVQVETNLFGYTRSRRDVEGTVTDSYDFLITNVRIGLTYRSEITVAFQPYGIVRPGRTIR